MAVLKWSALCSAGAAILVTIWLQGRTITAQSDRIASQAQYIGEVTAANTGLESALAARETSRQTAEIVLTQHAEKAETAASRARTLERRLTEALRNAKTFDLDMPLPADAAVALCLRYRAASGHGTTDNKGSTPGTADAGKGNTDASWCDNWRQLTLRDALHWIGLLLDHAGDERRDKGALRSWAESLQKQ